MTESRSSPPFALFTKHNVVKLMPPSNPAPVKSRLEEYRYKAAVLKQIMSNKSRHFRRINTAQNILTVVVSSALLFLGFTGVAKIAGLISGDPSISTDWINLLFNGLLFLLFLIGVLHLVFQFGQKQAQADRAVAALAALGNEIDDLVTTRGNLVISEDAEKVAQIRAKYEGIAENIPPNSDKDHSEAKADIAKKETSRPTIYLSPQMLFDPSKHEDIISAVAFGSREIVDALIALRTTREDLYLGGGLIRNAIWDFLHGYSSQTPVDDVDVIYFDNGKAEKRFDTELDALLRKEIPNLHWSSKNQARMHKANDEKEYTSIANAIERWPETATAFIVRLTSEGSLEFVAPYGFDDLLRLKVRVTPAFAGREAVVKARCEQKRWKELWPRLQIEI